MRFIGRFLWVIISLGATALAMVFAVSNNHMATVRFWPVSGQLELATWILVLGAACAGALFGGGLVWMSLIAARSRNWRLQRQLGKAEQRATTAETKLAETKLAETKMAEAESTGPSSPPALGDPG